MISQDEYIRHSLELNLFFLRILKEHTIFAAASLPPRDANLSMNAVSLKNNIEQLLDRTVSIARGNISTEVMTSGELVTDLTLAAEEKTQFLTGIPINTAITRRELSLGYRKISNSAGNLLDNVTIINHEAIALTNNTIAFKTNLLNGVLSCKAFSYIYPLMLEHVIREAQFYVMMLNRLLVRDPMDSMKEIIRLEILWNDIMGEHAKFIRGYLDPSEEELFETANRFAKEFDRLLAETKALNKNPKLLPEVTSESLKRVTNLRNFKVQGEKGILACKVKSIIPPLLSDHVTREANHYLRLLKSFSKAY